MKVKKLKIFAAARGFYGRRKNCWATSVRAVHKAWQYAYVGRRLKKRDFRATWIQQINAGAREHGLTYSIVMKWLPALGITINRKALASLAATEPYAFRAIVELVRARAAPGPASAAAGAAQGPAKRAIKAAVPQLR